MSFLKKVTSPLHHQCHSFSNLLIELWYVCLALSLGIEINATAAPSGDPARSHSFRFKLAAIEMEDGDIQDAATDEDMESGIMSAITEVAKPKGQIVEVLTKEQEERIAEVELFLIKHDVKVNRKKKKLLANLPVGPYETYKLGVVVANCCKVRFPFSSPMFIKRSI